MSLALSNSKLAKVMQDVLKIMYVFGQAVTLAFLTFL